MKIKTRLLLTEMALIFLATILLIVDLLFSTQERKLDEANNQYYKLSKSTSELAVYNKELLTTKDLDVTIKAWEEKVQEFRKNIKIYTSNPKVIKLINSEENFKSLLNLYSIVDNDIKEMEKFIKERYPSIKMSLISQPIFLIINSDLKLKFEVFFVYELNEFSEKIRNIGLSLDDIFIKIFKRITEDVDKNLEKERSYIEIVRSVIKYTNTLIISLFILPIFFTFKKKFKPFEKSIEKLKEGDFLEQVNEQGNDEFSHIAKLINSLSSSIRIAFISIQDYSEKLDTTGNTLMQDSTEHFDSLEKIKLIISQLNDKVNILERVVRSTRESSENVSKSINLISQETENQSDCIQESSAAISEMISNINSIATSTESKRKSIENLVITMSKIEEKMSELLEKHTKVSENLDTMYEIVDVIKSISSQTELLSMNAAIEAAHAGEFGKGFAVVADEIKKLSDSSKEELKLISEKIIQISEIIINTLQEYKDISVTIGSAVKETSQVSNLMNETLCGLQEMSSGSEQITTALGKITSLTSEIRNTLLTIENFSSIVLENSTESDNFTKQARDGILEILNGVQVINKSAGLINDVSKDNREISRILREKMEGFRLK